MNTAENKMLTAEYREVRQQMATGDVIAFGGKGEFSNIIKFGTRSPVSHVGMVIKCRLLGDSKTRYFNEVIESTTLLDFDAESIKGVQKHRLSERVEHYDGDIWWLPLRRKYPDTVIIEMVEFLYAQLGKPYDIKQAIFSALDRIPDSQEDFSKFFCSELIAAAFEQAKIVPPVNASEVTPIDLCRWNIFCPTYYQLSGSVKNIPGYNTKRPS